MHFPFVFFPGVSFATGVHAATAARAGADGPAAIPDPRHITHGWNVPSEGYADQPYIVQTDDGAWLCVITTGSGAEGSPGQHVVSMRSTNRGRSWEPIVRSPRRIVQPVRGARDCA
ncbi:MAG: hypothetical protein ACREH8_06790 [Opitutaceae bacterium]